MSSSVQTTEKTTMTENMIAAVTPAGASVSSLCTSTVTETTAVSGRKKSKNPVGENFARAPFFFI